MAHFNHFAPQQYKEILFSDLGIGDKFREDFFAGKRRRSNIICIKTGEVSFVEQKSKNEHKLIFADSYLVYSFSEKVQP